MKAIEATATLHNMLAAFSNKFHEETGYYLHCSIHNDALTPRYVHWFGDENDKSICEINVPSDINDFPKIKGLFAKDQSGVIWLLRKATGFTTKKPRINISSCIINALKNRLVTVERGNQSFEDVIKITSMNNMSSKNFMDFLNAIQACRNDISKNAWINQLNIPNSLLNTKSDIDKYFQNSLDDSLKNSSETRLARIANATTTPAKISVTTTVFLRNPDIVAEVLFKANGKCQACNNQAPFNRRRDGTPYLEVHHRVPLAEGGEDTLENAIALCPNCHRKEHYS